MRRPGGAWMFNYGDDSMQIMKRGLGLASALVVAWMVAPVQAHHSFAMFDMTKSVVLKGDRDGISMDQPALLGYR